MNMPAFRAGEPEAQALILETGDEWASRWPRVMQAVEVVVEQAYWNSPKRIPRQP